MYRITQLTTGMFLCECQIQDGTESWQEAIRQEAVQSLIRAARTLNGVYIREDDIEFCYEKKYKLVDNTTDDEKKLLEDTG